jgi:hypothetical protein
MLGYKTACGFFNIALSIMFGIHENPLCEAFLAHG